MSMFSSFFGGAPTMKLTWTNQESLPVIDKLHLFGADQPVSGKVEVILPGNTKKVEHQGIKAELIGQIELAYDRGNHYVFVSSQQTLAEPGILTSDTSYSFNFDSAKKSLSKQYDSYNGINVRLRYFVRCRLIRSYGSVSKEFDFAVQKIGAEPESNSTLKMEVGIEDCLHIEFEYDKSKYHLRDVIRGKIFFLLVRIKIKHMELQILKRESTGSGPNLYNETEVITKFEIMDGQPIKGENIPIRVFLEPYALTPTMRAVHNRFSVKYYLNLVLVDEEERRYFKQQEILLWREDMHIKSDPFAKPLTK